MNIVGSEINQVYNNYNICFEKKMMNNIHFQKEFALLIVIIVSI